jgi:hypothetical protein
MLWFLAGLRLISLKKEPNENPHNQTGVSPMSWKATAFVKELRDGLTVTEKFVLLMLAEYHRTDDQLSWPSTKTLAYDCLIEERSVKRVLARLEDNGFIERAKGGGQGHTTAYKFIGLEEVKGDRKTVTRRTLTQTVTVEATNSDRNSDPAGNAIRNARGTPVKESTRGETAPLSPEVIPPDQTLLVDEIPDGLHPNQYATRLLEEIRFPVVASNIRAVAAAIECEGKAMGMVAAYEFVLECTKFAMFEKCEINTFFFTDQKYRPERRNGNGRQVSAAAQRTSNTRRGLIDAVRNLASEATRRDGTERKNGT